MNEIIQLKRIISFGIRFGPKESTVVKLIS